MIKTAEQLLSEIRKLIWADQEPENLIDQHNEHFQEALAFIAENVACEREGNIDIIDFCKTFSKCGTTIIPEPRGIIRRVFTLVKESETGEDWCDPVYYDEVDHPLPEYFGKYAMARMKDLPSFPRSFDLGFHAADASQDCPNGRARRGMFCKHGGNIIVAPWIQSVERLCVEWDGPKLRWNDEDPVNPELLYRKAVMLYWHYLHEYWFGDRKAAGEIHDVTMQSGRGTFDRALADIIYTCENRRKVRIIKNDPYHQWRCLLNPVIEMMGKPLTPPGPTILAHIGNFVDGVCSPVAGLIDNHAGSIVLAAGVNVSNELGISYDQLVGSNYHGYLSPYYGHFGSSATKNKFWPAAGATDWEDGLEGFHSFFATPKNSNYYEVCLGPVHLFVLDINPQEPDGSTADSAQAQWLAAKMALSPAPWKIVLCYTIPDPIWDFKAMGAHMVLTGLRYYRRRQVNGLVIINNGAGGGPQDSPAGEAGEVITTDDHNGAGFIVASKCSLTYTFVDVNNNPVDSFAMHKPSDCVDPNEQDASTVLGVASAAATTIACGKQVYKNAGDPNGVITPQTTAKCYCIDTANNILWVKEDGVISNTGWQ